MENSKNSSLSKLIPVMLCFFAMGFVDLVGIASNYVKADLGLSDSQANIFPSLVFFWFLIFSVPTGNSIREQAAVIIQQNLQEIGIKTKIESADFATHLTKVREGNYDLGLIGSGGSPDPSECVINFKPDHINNFSHLSDWTIYNTGAEGEHAFSFEDRKVNYDNYQELLVEQVPFCFLYFQNNLFAYNNRIGNVKDNQDYSQLNRDVWNWTIEK